MLKSEQQKIFKPTMPMGNSANLVLVRRKSLSSRFRGAPIVLLDNPSKMGGKSDICAVSIMNIHKFSMNTRNSLVS